MQTTINWISVKDKLPEQNMEIGYLILRPDGKRFSMLAAYCKLYNLSGKQFVSWYAYPGRTLIKDVEYYAINTNLKGE